MSLRNQVLRGGVYLTLRQTFGMVVGLVGAILLTRAIGPANYGLFAAASGVFIYLQNFSQWGISVYLVRHEGEDTPKVYNQAFTLMLLLGLGGMLLGLIGIPLLGRWVHLSGFRPVAQMLFLSLPIALLGQVPLAQLERRLRYKRVAMVELGGQVVYYIIALPLAFHGLGVWAPVAGWWTQQLLMLLFFYIAAGYRPWFYWRSDLAKEMISYGLGFSASTWVWQLRSLVNPLIVSRFAGAEAVGYVALAIRVVETLSFVKAATWRISIAALARLQGDYNRLLKAVSEGMRLQILALGPFLVGFAMVASRVLPVLFGHRWLPVLEIYPFIALSYLTNAMFNMHSSALYVLRKNWEVTIFHLSHILLFAGTAFVLVPRLGLVGYGWAEFVALGSYAVIHTYLAKSIGSPDYRLAGVWWIGMVLPLFWRDLGPWTALGLVLVMLWPGTIQALKHYAVDLRRVRYES